MCPEVPPSHPAVDMFECRQMLWSAACERGGNRDDREEREAPTKSGRSSFSNAESGATHQHRPTRR